MNQFLRKMQLLRALLMWVPMFIVLYGLTLVLYALYVVQPSLAVMMTMQVHTPLVFLFFSWLHFRKVRENTWSVRIATSVLWIILSILMSAILIKPIYGYDWTYVITPYVFQGQLFNVAAMFVGGYLASRPRAKIIEIPKSVEKKLEKRGF